MLSGRAQPQGVAEGVFYGQDLPDNIWFHHTIS